MKRTFIALVIAATLPFCAVAQMQGTVEQARVVSVTALPGPVVPRQQCSQTQTQTRNPNGAFEGAAVGGAIGSTMGQGDGKVAMVLLGALLGVAAGQQPSVSTSWHCDTVYENQGSGGYQVRYVFHGKVYSIVMPFNPGEYVQIQSNYTVQ